MTRNNHRGDSISKRVARFEFYLRARAFMGEERFAKSRFLYLASFEGGDASVLKAFGVPASNQLAVDFDKASILEFSNKYPDIPTFCGPVELAGSKGSFDCIFLDFCANLSDATIKSCVLTSRRLAARDGSIFAFAILRGREMGWKGRIEAAGKRVLEASLRDARNRGMLGIEPESVKRRLGDGRTAIIYKHVDDELNKRNAVLTTLTKITYRSVDPEELAAGKPGTPMIIAAYTSVVTKPCQRLADCGKAASNRNSLILYEWSRIGAILCTDHLTYEFDHRLTLGERDRVLRLAAVNGGPMLDLVGYESRACLCRAITNCDLQDVDPSLALNLKPGTVAALRAHATRGTYRARDLKERSKIVEHLGAALEAYGVANDNYIAVVGGDPFTDIANGLARALDNKKDAASIRGVRRESVAREIAAAESCKQADLNALALAILRSAGLTDRIGYSPTAMGGLDAVVAEVTLAADYPANDQSKRSA